MESYSKSLVDKKIEEIKAGRNSYEIGLVTAVKEYILTVRGLENAVFMERVLIGNGARDTSTRSADRKSVSPS